MSDRYVQGQGHSDLGRLLGSLREKVPKTPFLRAGVVLSLQLFLCLAHLILLYQPASPKMKTSNEHLTKKKIPNS